MLAIGLVAGMLTKQCVRTEFSELRPQHHVDVDTIHYIDTVCYRVPVAKTEVPQEPKITFIPTWNPRDSVAPGDSLSAKDKQAYAILAQDGNDGNASPDSVAVEIPITQKEYEGEEYHAWVSGYEPRLDSIYIFPRHDVVRVREPQLVDDLNPKRWGIGVFAGYGYTPNGFQPCVGISINYNLIQF